MQLWAGPAHYPDFLALRAQSWWKDQIDTFNAMLPVDGIWLDMDEPDNFCSCDVAYNPGRYLILHEASSKLKSSQYRKYGNMLLLSCINRRLHVCGASADGCACVSEVYPDSPQPQIAESTGSDVQAMWGRLLTLCAGWSASGVWLTWQA